MKLKFSGKAYLLIVTNCENFKEIEEPSLLALGDLNWNDPYTFQKVLWIDIYESNQKFLEKV